MAYTLQQFRTQAASIASAQTITFKAGYVEDINRVSGFTTTGKLLILILPKNIKARRSNDKVATVLFTYFERHLSNDTRDDFEMSSVVAENLWTYLKALFPRTQSNFAVHNGEDFEITNFGKDLDKNTDFACSCQINVLLNC